MISAAENKRKHNKRFGYFKYLLKEDDFYCSAFLKGYRSRLYELKSSVLHEPEKFIYFLPTDDKYKKKL